MGYDALPASSPSDDPNNDDVYALDYSNRNNKQQKCIWRVSIANLVLLVVQIGLLAAHIVIQREHDDKGESYIQGTYGFDTKYMSLDHGYDWLWEERAIQRGGGIAIRKDDNGTVLEYGVISM